MFDIIFGNYEIFLLVMMRMTGVIFLNPIFGRRNIPAYVKAGIVLLISVVVTGPMPVYETGIYGMPSLILAVIKEIAVGYIIGLILNIFLSIAPVAGDIADTQMGLGMSKMYDPSLNMQMPLTGNFFNIWMIAIFFLSGAHLSIIQLGALSFNVIPAGFTPLNPGVGLYVAELMGHVLALALKLSLPFIAAELISEVGIGIVMRAVPQINVFVVGIQLKVIIGIIVLIVLCPVLSWFFDDAMVQMFDAMQEALFIAGST